MPADPLSVPCQVCGASPQKFCTRPDGTVAPWTHRGRDRRAETREAIDAEFGAIQNSDAGDS
jgi:hypothetical protein